MLGRKTTCKALGEWGKLAAQDPERYGPAAQQLRAKADRVFQRQKEQRQHEKNLRQGKRKPWAPPPKEEAPPGPEKTRPTKALGPAPARRGEAGPVRQGKAQGCP